LIIVNIVLANRKWRRRAEKLGFSTLQSFQNKYDLSSLTPQNLVVARDAIEREVGRRSIRGSYWRPQAFWARYSSTHCGGWRQCAFLASSEFGWLRLGLFRLLLSGSAAAASALGNFTPNAFAD
jgi:hypothetical protein